MARSRLWVLAALLVVPIAGCSRGPEPGAAYAAFGGSGGDCFDEPYPLAYGLSTVFPEQESVGGPVKVLSIDMVVEDSSQFELVEGPFISSGSFVGAIKRDLPPEDEWDTTAEGDLDPKVPEQTEGAAIIETVGEVPGYGTMVIMHVEAVPDVEQANGVVVVHGFEIVYEVNGQAYEADLEMASATDLSGTYCGDIGGPESQYDRLLGVEDWDSAERVRVTLPA